MSNIHNWLQISGVIITQSIWVRVMNHAAKDSALCDNWATEPVRSMNEYLCIFWDCNAAISSCFGAGVKLDT